MRVILLAVMLAAPSAAVVADSRPPLAFRVIVNSQNPVTSIDRKFLSDVFLKKQTRWGHQETIRPVDLRADSSVRQAFSEDVLKRSVAAVKNYWQQLIFAGREVPPPEVDSDDGVVRFVLRYSGAVGYVSGNTDTEGVKVLTIR